MIYPVRMAKFYFVAYNVAVRYAYFLMTVTLTTIISFPFSYAFFSLLTCHKLNDSIYHLPFLSLNIRSNKLFPFWENYT